MTAKEEFIRKFNEAFIHNDIDFILENMTKDIRWNMVGVKEMKGLDVIKEELQEMKHVKTIKLNILQTITHGKAASCHGEMTIIDETGEEKSYGFSDVYEFSGFKNPKIKQMTSYVIALK